MISLSQSRRLCRDIPDPLAVAERAEEKSRPLWRSESAVPDPLHPEEADDDE